MSKKMNDTEKMLKKREKRAREMSEKRAILLCADKKVRVVSDTDLYVFLNNFTPINLKMFDVCYVKFENVAKSIYDDYLVKIWIDEDKIFHAEDDFPNGNWFVEADTRKLQKLYDAFGHFDIYDEELI